MKLRNKNTGEIVDFEYLQTDHVAQLVLTTYENDKPEMYKYNSLVELNEEWEDYKESKEYWYISCSGKVEKATQDEDDFNETHINGHKSIGNYFETKEEAEKAVEKLKAWKRVKDKGFRFKRWKCENQRLSAVFQFDKEAWSVETEPDLDLLFGGEE